MSITKDWPNVHDQVSDLCSNCDHRTSFTLTWQRRMWPRVDADSRHAGHLRRVAHGSRMAV
jgi:hypothetical protein